MKLEFKRPSEIDCSENICLDTNPRVRRQMVVASDKFSVTSLFPRRRVKGIRRIGFQPYGEVEIAGERFIRYRSYAPALQDK